MVTFGSADSYETITTINRLKDCWRSLGGRGSSALTRYFLLNVPKTSNAHALRNATPPNGVTMTSPRIPVRLSA